jgi:hypothetical protein
MKKIVMLIMAIVLVIGVCSNAMAYFEDQHLFRVVYDRAGTNEVVTDLGLISSLTAPTTANWAFAGQSTWDASMFSASPNLYVAYFAQKAGSTGNAWTSGPDGGQLFRQWSAFSSGGNSIKAEYQMYGTSQVIGPKTDNRSYWSVMDQGTLGAAGSFNLAIAAKNGEAAVNTAPLGYVDQMLYFYGSVNSFTSNKVGVALATIRTYSDGHTELNPSAVPVPAAVYLLGSGLLGLVGIRRKMAA